MLPPGDLDRAKQIFELTLPFGVSQFTVTRGTDVIFATTTATRLVMSAQQLSETDTRTTIIIAGMVIVGALFYISRATDHRWLVSLRGRIVPTTVIVPIVQSVSSAGRGPEMRAYGDNRADTSKS